MATRFWVPQNGTLTWAITGPTNWGSASGVADNQSVPGTGDIAVFDGGSGTGNSIIGASITVQGLECDGSTLGTGAYAGTITHNTAVTLTINTGAANSFRLASGMTYTPASTTSLITLTHTSGTANVKTYGKALAALTINGAGGTTQTLDDLKVNAVQNSALTVTSGIFDANGGAGGPFAITANEIVATGAVARSLILGGTVTIGGTAAAGQTIWNLGGSILTFTKNSANIVVLPPSSVLANGSWTFNLFGQTYNNWTFNASTNNSFVNFSSVGGPTFANLTIGSGWSLLLINALTYTSSNPFTWTGTQTNPILINGTNGNVTTISCPSGACALNWGAIQCSTASGGATFTATNTLNLGANSGWSISAPADATITPPAGSIAALARGTVTTGASTTSVPTSALSFAGVAATGVVSNQFVPRVILFDGATLTAGLQGAAAAISSNTASNTPTISTSTALPATPASGDTFTII